jgi:DNA-binding CsgD family transcriptional regulator
MRLNATGPFLDVAILHERHSNDASSAPAVAPFLAPLLSRTLEASRVVATLAQSYAMLLSLFDRLSFGAAFCEPSGRLVLSNSALDVIVEDRDGLMRIGDRLAPTAKADAEPMRTALDAALGVSAAPAPSVFTLRRRSGALPLLCWVAPLRSQDLGPLPLVLVLVLDPEEDNLLTAEGLRGFGLLSEAELSVCDYLVRGFETDQIADQRDASPETVRSQVKAAAAKLACRSRLDLVRLALASRPPLKHHGAP